MRCECTIDWRISARGEEASSAKPSQERAGLSAGV